jgi:hypothetical protein
MITMQLNSLPYYITPIIPRVRNDIVELQFIALKPHYYIKAGDPKMTSADFGIFKNRVLVYTYCQGHSWGEGRGVRTFPCKEK